MLLINRLFFARLILLSVFIVALLGCGSGEKTSNVSSTNTQQVFLPVDEAFAFSASVENEKMLKTRWVIADGYHLYKERFKFSVTPENYKIVDVVYPKAVVFKDKNLGDLESYSGEIEVSIKITGDVSSEKLSLTSSYQGCADVGLCYPPETRTKTFNLANL